MKNVSQTIQRFFFSNVFHVAITFLLGGLLLGAFFVWLTNLPALEPVFFVPDLKFTRIAIFSWYATFGLFFALGLFAAFLISAQRNDFIRIFRLSKLRLLSSFVIIAGIVPFLYLLFGATIFLIDGNLLLILPALFLSLLAAAMCILTRSLRLLPVAFLTNLFYLLVASGIIVLIFPFTRTQSNYISEFVEWTTLFSLMSLGFGLWLSWRSAREKRKGA